MSHRFVSELLQQSESEEFHYTVMVHQRVWQAL